MHRSQPPSGTSQAGPRVPGTGSLSTTIFRCRQWRSHTVGPLSDFPPAQPLTCPVGELLAPPGLPLQRSRLPRGHCRPKGHVPRAPALWPHPTAEAARGTCLVLGGGQRRQAAPSPASARSAPPTSQHAAPRGPLTAPTSHSNPPISRGLAATPTPDTFPTPSTFPGHVARAPAGIPRTPPGGRGGWVRPWRLAWGTT